MKAIAVGTLTARRDVRLGTLFDRLAAVHGSRPLVEELGPEAHRTLTHREAAEVVRRWAAGLAWADPSSDDVAVVPGERVVLALPNGYDVLLACSAVARAGGVPVPVNPQMRPAEVDHVIEDSGATVVVRSADELDRRAAAAGTAHRRDVLEVPAAAGDDVAALFYTSGTTGKPKGARLTHRGLLGTVPPAAAWGSTAGRLRRDELVAGLPVAHIMGFSVLVGSAAAGVPVAFLPRFRPDAALDAIEGRRATMFVGVPAMYRMLLDAGAERRDLRSVRMWGSGADVMPPGMAKRFQRMGASASVPILSRTVGEALFVEGYGLVETGGVVALRVSPPVVGVSGSLLGVPLPGYRFRVVGDGGEEVPPGATGELWVRGPGVLRGYHGDSAASAAAVTDDGWLRTGDLARRGALGLVAFAGRRKDVIKRGGYSVYAVEVEGVLEAHPDVHEVAVVGLPDERDGEVPVAAVVLRDGADAGAAPASVEAFARDRLAAYKVPARVVLVDDLPRTGTEKVQRPQVRERLLRGEAG